MIQTINRTVILPLICVYFVLAALIISNISKGSIDTRANQPFYIADTVEIDQGVTTLLLVLLTVGIRILAIPFYPLRCSISKSGSLTKGKEHASKVIDPYIAETLHILTKIKFNLNLQIPLRIDIKVD